MTGNADITDRVVTTANRLEDVDDPFEIDYLDAEYTVTSNGDVKEVKIAITLGGPSIWVNCLSGTVEGSWGGDRHTTHVDSDAVDELGRHLADQFESTMMA